MVDQIGVFVCTLLHVIHSVVSRSCHPSYVDYNYITGCALLVSNPFGTQ